MSKEMRTQALYGTFSQVSPPLEAENGLADAVSHINTGTGPRLISSGGQDMSALTLSTEAATSAGVRS